MVIATLSMAALALVGREVSAELPITQLMFYRSAISIPLVVIAALFVHGSLRPLATRRLGLHLLRNGMHFIAQFGWFYAIAHVALAQVFALEFTMPLWITILAPILIGERLTMARLMAAVIGFIGILLVVHPGSAALNLGTCAALMAALFFALSVISVRRLTTTETPLQVVFFMAMMQAVMALAVSVGGLSVPGPRLCALLAVIALLGLLAQFAMARAFARADTMLVMPIDFLRLPLIAGAGAVLYAEAFEPMILAGGALILAGNIWNLTAERGSKPG